jgi:MFS transporter, FSR family, fosmidomycin resistance protein
MLAAKLVETSGMTAPQLTLSAPSAAETRMIASVSAAHFVSHFYFLVLPPLFVFVQAEYHLTYTGLAVPLTVFAIVSAIFQTPAGLLADRIGPFAVLVAGLVLGAVAFALTGLVHSYWFLVAMFALAGLGNTVYHPADYALLSHHVAGERMGSAFSIHTFAGMLGGAVAPATILFTQTLVGWRGAFMLAAALGLAVAAALLVMREDFADGPHHAAKARAREGAAVDRRKLLLSWPILASFAFFTMQAAAGVGIMNFGPIALQALFNVPIELGNVALSTSLLLGAIGVLAGGLAVTRVRSQQAFAALGLFVAGISILLVGIADFGTIMLITLMGINGFAGGIIMPSRDLLVREVTPPGAFGTVFGFVTTGFNVAGVAFPLMFAALLDHAMPRSVFILSAVFCLLSILTVVTVRARKSFV